MRARCISYSGDRATVVLEPGLIARLFGARTRSVDLERTTFADGSHRGWITVVTRRDIDHLEERVLLRNALDFREVGSPNRWQLGCGTEAVGL